MKPIAFLLPLMLGYCGETLGDKDGNYEWYVKNNTNKPVTIDCPWLMDNINTIEVGDSLTVGFYFHLKGNEPIPFEALFNVRDDWTFSIIENGRIVKAWASNDNDEEMRQFQDEACWRRSEYEKKYGKKYYTYVSWTFDILPEDLEYSLVE